MESSLSSCLTHPIISQDYPRTPSPSLSPERSIRKNSTIEDQPTIKMEDLEQQSNADTLGGAHSPTPSLTDSSKTSSDGKPVKKRKSWGQVLPEPKTNLPPRKRAKTADEKEQRRIERVKRNRLAAHNSRERKRQEVELLQNEKEELEARLARVQESHDKMAAELKAFKRMMPGVSPQPESIDSVTSTTVVQDHASSFDDVATPPTSSTINPRHTSFPTPESMSIDCVDSPLDTSSQPATPAADEPTLADLDRTQHSAVSVEASFIGQCEPSLGGDPMVSFAPSYVVESPVSNDFFDFDNFCGPPSAAAPELTGPGAEATLFDGDAHFDSLDAFDPLGAKTFDLQADSGATDFVSDEPGIAA